MFQVTLPSQSIFGNGTAERRPLHEYTDYVRANSQNLMSVISRMSFDMDSSSTKVGFKPIRILNDEEYDLCSEKSKSDDAKRAITLSVNINKDESVQTPPPAPTAEPAPKPRPVDAFSETKPTEEDNIPEPTKRAEPKVEPKAKAPDPKPATGDVSLDDLVDDWT